MPRTKAASKKRAAGPSHRDSDSEPELVAHPPGTFETPENEAWYRERHGRNMVVEKTLSPRLEGIFQVRRVFQSLNWEGVLDLHGDYYPDLVKQFYANIREKDKAGLPVIESSVRGTRILITQTVIEHTLWAPAAPRHLSFHYGLPKDHGTWSKTQALARLGITETYTATGRPEMLCKGLEIQARLVAYILGANVNPQASGLNALRLADLYMLDCLYHGFEGAAPISLSEVIMSSIASVVRSKLSTKTFVFPVLISRILVEQGVRVNHAVTAHTGHATIIDDTRMLAFGYVLQGTEWVNPQRQIPGAAAPQPAEDPDAQVEPQQPDAGPVHTRGLLRRLIASVDELREEVRQHRTVQAEILSHQQQLDLKFDLLLQRFPDPGPPPPPGSS